MIILLPQEFKTLQEINDFVEESATRLLQDPQQAIFDKPPRSKHHHMKALYINRFINGDGGAAVNIIMIVTFRMLAKCIKDLMKMNVVLKDFEGNTSDAQGALNVELTIGSKTIPTTFFIISRKGSYNLPLRRDWIQANCCIPSKMHQCMI
jgi:hypothetical protein